jgi:hypothetical protein
MSAFATLADVQTLTGMTYSEAEQGRINALLPMVSDALCWEAERVGQNLQQMIYENDALASVAKMVTVDIVVRVLRQSQEGEPMSQESQSALGYTWSGTYAVPGGGISGAIMRNDLKRLGIKRQRYGVIDLWPAESTEQQYNCRS